MPDRTKAQPAELARFTAVAAAATTALHVDNVVVFVQSKWGGELTGKAVLPAH